MVKILNHLDRRVTVRIAFRPAPAALEKLGESETREAEEGFIS